MLRKCFTVFILQVGDVVFREWRVDGRIQNFPKGATAYLKKVYHRQKQRKSIKHNLTQYAVMVRYKMQRGCYVIFIMSLVGGH